MGEKNENMKHSFEVTYSDWMPACFRPYIEIYATVPWEKLWDLPEPENESGLFWFWQMDVNASTDKTPLKMECTFGNYPEIFHGELMLISLIQDDRNRVLMIKCHDPDEILVEKILPDWQRQKKTKENQQITLKYR